MKGTGLAFVTDVTLVRLSSMSLNYGLPVSQRSAAACEDKKNRDPRPVASHTGCPYHQSGYLEEYPCFEGVQKQPAHRIESQ